MTDRTPPASRPELVDQYRAAAQRCDWQGMVVAKEELAARAEYDVAMEIRRAQENLRRARTRLEAVQTERSVVKQALEQARDRAPLAIDQAPIVSNDPRVMARATIEAYWRDALPKLEEAVTAAEGRCRDADQSASAAQATLDRLLAAAYARVQSGAKEENKA